MGKFENALTEGMASAKAAKEAIQEINTIFKELADDVSEFTGNKVTISKAIRQRRVVDGPDWAALALAIPTKKEDYWAILAHAFGADSSKGTVLAEWVPGRGGYPCTIKWEGFEHRALDGAGLIHSLSALLSDPIIADKILDVQNEQG